MSTQIDPDILPKAIATAYDNWCSWRQAFEEDQFAILSRPPLFNRFCQEYGVGRTIRRSLRNRFREHLLANFSQAGSFCCPETIDLLDQDSRKNYASSTGNSLRSVISKTAVFIWPDRFIAWDKYAPAGLRTLQGERRLELFGTYGAYMVAINRALDNGVRRQLTMALAEEPIKTSGQDSDAFLLRVFDVSLMILGQGSDLMDAPVLSDATRKTRRYTVQYDPCNG